MARNCTRETASSTATLQNNTVRRRAGKAISQFTEIPVFPDIH
jgi:hypothetical protein